MVNQLLRILDDKMIDNQVSIHVLQYIFSHDYAKPKLKDKVQIACPSGWFTYEEAR